MNPHKCFDTSVVREAGFRRTLLKTTSVCSKLKADLCFQITSCVLVFISYAVSKIKLLKGSFSSQSNAYNEHASAQITAGIQEQTAQISHPVNDTLTVQDGKRQLL